MFIVSGPFRGTNFDIFKDILQASSFQYVIVISSLCPAMHTVVRFGSNERELRAFEEFEEQLLEWMGNMVCTGMMFKQ